MQREIELGSIQTAWMMLHRYRSVMVRPGRERLHGDVEVDESFIGGPEPGVRGRGAPGKVLIAGAVERVGIAS
ncbi:ISSod11, transposase [Leifsonia rubra CMS 76R]|nr:ISSod11, transposase [Leifsonia rubra CMS 76R]